MIVDAPTIGYAVKSTAMSMYQNGCEYGCSSTQDVKLGMKMYYCGCAQRRWMCSNICVWIRIL